MNKTLWKYVIIFGLNAAAVTIIANVYNNYLPIYLQAGHAGYDVGGVLTTLGFGLTPFLAGLVMSVDNVAGFIFSPLIGLWSDRLGKRRRFVLASIPLGAVGVLLIPLAVGWITPETNGQLAQLVVPFILLMLGASLVILSGVVASIPNGALTLELVPSEQRTKVFGLITFVSSIGGVAIFALTGILYSINSALPFALGAAVTVLVGLLYWFFIQDPAQLSEQAAGKGPQSIGAILAGVRDLPTAIARSLWFLLLANFFWQFGVAAFQTYYSSYAVNVLQMAEAETIQMGLAFTVGQMLMTIPAGFLAARIGRKRTIVIGLLAFLILSLVIFFLPVKLLVLALTALGGAFWAMVIVSALPMLSDIIPGGKYLTTVLSLNYLLVTLSFIVAVPLAGWVVGLFNTNYNMLWLINVTFLIISLSLLSFVRHGEVPATPASEG